MEYKTYHRIENINGCDIAHVLGIVNSIVGVFSTHAFANKGHDNHSVSVNCTKSQWDDINNQLGLAKNPTNNRFGYYLSKNYEA